MVDVHLLLRRGLAALINGESDLWICAEATTESSALEAIAATDPHLAIIGIAFEKRAEMDFVTRIRSLHPDLFLLLMSMQVAPVFADWALNEGASGYISKLELDDTLLIAVRSVLNGERYLSPKVKYGAAREATSRVLPTL